MAQLTLIKLLTMHQTQLRYDSVINKIRSAELKFLRQPRSVKLVAASKAQPATAIRDLFNLGQSIFGESYLQEAVEKQDNLSDLEIEWHFIGQIQSNKTKEIAEKFQWVHSVDRLKIARRLSDQRPAHLAPLNICLQVNLENEVTKSGAHIEQCQLISQQIKLLPQVRLRGLMAIPSAHHSFTKQCQVFAQLRLLMSSLNEAGHQLSVLSMGMSNDMEAAIAEGATHIRIGTALFGSRDHF